MRLRRPGVVGTAATPQQRPMQAQRAPPRIDQPTLSPQQNVSGLRPPGPLTQQPQQPQQWPEGWPVQQPRQEPRQPWQQPQQQQPQQLQQQPQQPQQQRPTLQQPQQQRPEELGLPFQQQAQPESVLRLQPQAQPQQSLALAVRPRQQRQRPVNFVSVVRSMMIDLPVYSEEDASSFGVVQALMVALSAQRVVSIDIKGERWPWSRADRNVPLAAMTQIGDCVLIKDNASANGRTEYDNAGDISGLVGLPVYAADGTWLGRVRDFSFDPESGQLVRIKYDTVSYSITLPFDLRSTTPAVPENLVSVWSVPVQDLMQMTLGGVQLMPYVVPLQERKGPLGGFANSFRSLGGWGDEQDAALILDPAVQRWEASFGAATRRRYGLAPDAPYARVLEALANENSQTQQKQQQPLQLPAPSQQPQYYDGRPIPQGQDMRSSSSRQDPRSRRNRGMAPQQAQQGFPESAGPRGQPPRQQAPMQQLAPQQPGVPSRRDSLRREVGEMRQGYAQGGGQRPQWDGPQQPTRGMQDGSGGSSFLRFAKPELFRPEGWR